jgi:hypothetical protein
MTTMEHTNITFDASDPGRLAAFWAAATGRQRAESTPAVAVLTSATDPVRLLLLKVPGAKTVTNRMPLDFQAADRVAEVARVRGRGAMEHATHQDCGLTWTVMTDPEGNACCIVQA